MPGRKHNLNIAEFDSLIGTYVESLGGKFLVTKVENKGKVDYKFQEKSTGKDVSILTCYNSVGRTSFVIGGKKSEIAHKCSEYLIEHAAITIPDSRAFTIRPASDEEVSEIIEFLVTYANCRFEELKAIDSIKRLLKFEGEYHDVITLTHYKTGTLMIQGRPSMLFISFIDIATELFNPAEVKREYIRTFESGTDINVIDSNLSTHLPNGYHVLGQKLEAIMAPSLILLNSPKDLPDYTAYAFPILRGSEGVLKKIFKDVGIEITDGFGEYFKVTRTTVEWAKDCSLLFPNYHLRKSLLDLYSFYHKERHTLLHTDATISTSRTLKYNESLEIVKNGLNFIDEVFRYSK